MSELGRIIDHFMLKGALYNFHVTRKIGGGVMHQQRFKKVMPGHRKFPAAVMEHLADEGLTNTSEAEERAAKLLHKKLEEIDALRKGKPA